MTPAPARALTRGKNGERRSLHGLEVDDGWPGEGVLDVELAGDGHDRPRGLRGGGLRNDDPLSPAVTGSGSAVHSWQ